MYVCICIYTLMCDLQNKFYESYSAPTGYPYIHTCMHAYIHAFALLAQKKKSGGQFTYVCMYIYIYTSICDVEKKKKICT